MRSTIQGATLSATLASVFLLGGCVLGTRNPTLTYPPAADATHAAVAATAEQSPPNHIRIVLGPFRDERSDKRTVGTTRNAFGMRMADVVPTNDVSEWVRRAIKTELEHNGYTVLDERGEQGSPGSGIVLSGDVLNVFCDMYISYTGQVSLIVRLSRDGKELLNKHYAGEGSAGLAVAATSDSYARSLALALSSALKKLVADLNETLRAEQ